MVDPVILRGVVYETDSLDMDISVGRAHCTGV